MIPNRATIAAIEAARRGDLVELGSPEAAIAELNDAGARYVIGGREYRMVYGHRELERIVYLDGSRPVACALVPADGEGAR